VQTSTAHKQPTNAITVDLSPEDAELAGKLGALVRYAMQNRDASFFQAIDELDLSLTQFKILVSLWDRESEMPLKIICGNLNLSLPAVSRSVDGLVQRGLVVRDEDPNDRRSKHISVTPEGHELLEKLVTLRAQSIVELVTELEPEQRRALSDALEPVVSRADVDAQRITVKPK
jgi:DNA-binding MarR family transcriptional regulator